MLVPTVLAMVICDAVWRDPETGKPALLGVFTQLGAVSLPVEREQMSVYAQLSGHLGWITVRAELYHADELDPDGTPTPLATTEAPVYFPDRVVTADVALTLYNVDLPAVGEYHLLLLSSGTPLAERRFWVIRPSQGEGDQ